jgi:hypothetical protein
MRSANLSEDQRPMLTGKPRGYKTMWGCAVTIFTIWVANEGRGSATHVGVYDAPNVNQAIEQALDKAALDSACDRGTLSIFGIAEGDLTACAHQT